MPPGCGQRPASGAVGAPERPAERRSPGKSTAGGGTVGGTSDSTAAAPAAGRSPAGVSGYVTDSRGNVVRGGFGDCWRSGTWTPAQATVIGCDGVLATVVPIPTPAPDTRSQAQPPAAPPVSPPAPPPAAPPPAPPAATPGGRDVLPVLPPSAVPPAAIAPEGLEEAAATGPTAEKVTLDTESYFDFDKAILKPEGRRKLQTLTERAKGMELEVVVAVGHTDATGTDAYNQRLSLRRAAAVKAFLVEQGIPAAKIFVDGKGEKQPVASNASRAGRAKNRRTEVELVGTRKKK